MFTLKTYFQELSIGADELPHSDQLPSYTTVPVTPIKLRANAIPVAVTPEPQVVIIGLSNFIFALANIFLISESDTISPVVVFINDVKGTLQDFGI